MTEYLVAFTIVVEQLVPVLVAEVSYWDSVVPPEGSGGAVVLLPLASIADRSLCSVDRILVPHECDDLFHLFLVPSQ